MKNCQIFIKQVRKIISFLVFLLYSTNLYASSFTDIIFKPATAEFVIDGKIEKSISNSVKISIKIDDNETIQDKIVKTPTITFYRYDEKSDDYLKVQETKFLESEEEIGVFNLMTSLLLKDGQKIDISKKIPAVKCQIFNKKDPLIIVYQDVASSKDKTITLKITTKKDKEIIKLKKIEKNSTMYIGYINTTISCPKKCDGKLYVEKGTLIDITTKLYSSNKQLRSLSEKEVVTAQARIEESGYIKVLDVKKELKSSVWVSINSTKQEVNKGGFTKFSISIINNGEKDLNNIILKNYLSNGAIYENNTFTKDDKKIDIKIDKNSFDLNIPLLKKGLKTTIDFIAFIDVNAKNFISSSSFVLYDNKSSNKAKSTLKIKDDFDDKSTIIGRVILDNNDKNISLNGIRIYLENGIYVESDIFGKYHFSNIEPRSHVVSIDSLSIKDRFELVECKQNVRMMGSKSSKFINTSNVHIQRVDFCLKKVKKKNKKIKYFIKKDKKLNMPNFTSKDIENIKEKTAFLWPPERFVPDMPTLKVAFIHKSNQNIELFLNDKKVNMLNFDGFITGKDKKYKISKYRGIDLVDGDNILKMKVGSKTITRKVHLSTAPVRAKFIKEKSYLKADGKNSPIIAVQLYDSSGYPLREGMVGEFSIESPYIAQDVLDELNNNPLSISSKKNRYIVSSDGIAYIRLQPTSTSGEVKIHFAFQNRNDFIKAWLSQSAREWFIVGFAEGEIGYNTIKNNLEKTTKLKTDKKASFFAKGEISSDVLLTIAYNSEKVDKNNLEKEINVESKYTIYADATLQNSEAPSSKKLYLKIEKDQFYALFGTFDTGFEEHELSRYSRRLNGIKSEFKGDYFDYSAFISDSKSKFFRDEIQGDGTSGLYYLRQKDILFGSEKISIEVRDRFRSEIIVNRKVLHSSYDYTIDYEAGTIYFKEPILSRDKDANPQYIIVEYELKNVNSNRYNYGGRVSTKLLKNKIELGVSTIAEQKSNNTDTLFGIDAKMKVNSNLIINAEVATTNTIQKDSKHSADAILLEAKYYTPHIESKAYFKRIEDGFGLKQQSSTQNDSQRYGIDTKFNYWKHISLNIAAYSDKALNTNEKKETLESIVRYKKELLITQLGYRYNNEYRNKSSSQFITSVSKRFFNSKLKILGAYERSIDGKSDLYPNRVFTELSYGLNQYIDLFANNELLRGVKLDTKESRVGIKARPWNGASIENSISQKYQNDSLRVFSNLGFYQGFQLDKEWYLNGSIEVEKSLKGKDKIEDFSAYTFGINYNKDIWSANSKIEYRTSDKEDKVNFDFGLYTQINENLGLAFGIRDNIVRTYDGNNNIFNTRFSVGYRPSQNLSIFNKLEYIYSKTKSNKLSKIINNALLTLSPTKRLELLAHYGIKYNLDYIDGDSFDSTIDTLGFEAIYNLSKKLEIAFHTNILHSYKSNNFEENIGTHLGFNIFKYTYIALGYNFSGFEDDDLVQDMQSSKGIYLKFRLKYDNETLKKILKVL